MTKIQQSTKYSKIMKRHGTILEPFKDYEKKYQERLNCFIQNTKLDEPDFIYSELEHWERMVSFIDKIFYSENPDISIKTELLSKGEITLFDLPVNEESAKHPILKSPLKIPSLIWGETEYHSKEWEELINFVCKETLEDSDLPLFTPDFVRNSVIHDFAAGKLEDYNSAAKRKIDFLKEKKRPPKEKSNQKRKVSYKWQGKPDDELPELYSLMIGKYELISPETTKEQFRAIFTEKSIDSITPIKWHQNNASELLYFIQKLEEKGLIKHTKKSDYQKMTACFVQPDGTKFEAAFKNLKTNITINLSSDKQNAIDKLVDNFL